MKTKDRQTEVADLKAVAQFQDELVLFIDSEDPNLPESVCVQADFGKRQFGLVQPVGIYLELNAYQRVHDGDMRIAYRQRILEEMKPDIVVDMLAEFNRIRFLHRENRELFRYNFPKWEPGG